MGPFGRLFRYFHLGNPRNLFFVCGTNARSLAPLEHAQLIQSTLAPSPAQADKSTKNSFDAMRLILRLIIVLTRYQTIRMPGQHVNAASLNTMHFKSRAGGREVSGSSCKRQCGVISPVNLEGVHAMMGFLKATKPVNTWQTLRWGKRDNLLISRRRCFLLLQIRHGLRTGDKSIGRL
jgi:hypothetical protein